MNGETIVYLRHILDAMNSIVRYSSGKTEAEFLADDMRHKAVIRDLEVIGEAAKRLSLDWQEKFPDVPWRKMARMRDKLIHHYMGIEMETVWATATEIGITLALRSDFPSPLGRGQGEGFHFPTIERHVPHPPLRGTFSQEEKEILFSLVDDFGGLKRLGDCSSSG